MSEHSKGLWKKIISFHFHKFLFPESQNPASNPASSSGIPITILEFHHGLSFSNPQLIKPLKLLYISSITFSPKPHVYFLPFLEIPLPELTKQTLPLILLPSLEFLSLFLNFIPFMAFPPSDMSNQVEEEVEETSGNIAIHVYKRAVAKKRKNRRAFIIYIKI